MAGSFPNFYRAERGEFGKLPATRARRVQSRTHRTCKCVSFLSHATSVKMYRGFYFIQYIISRFDNKHFRGQHTIESNYMQAEKCCTILSYNITVPKHCQNLLYKPNKPDCEEQISVAMFSLPHICHVSSWARLWTHPLLANRKAANTLGMG